MRKAKPEDELASPRILLLNNRRIRGLASSSSGLGEHSTTPRLCAGIIFCMPDAKDILDQYYLEMRWRCLSLAADLDRVERSANGPAVLETDPRLARLRQAIGVLLDGKTTRAEQVQNIFSDKTPPPPRDRK